MAEKIPGDLANDNRQLGSHSGSEEQFHLSVSKQNNTVQALIRYVLQNYMEQRLTFIQT